MCKLGGRDHNATSYSTETSLQPKENPYQLRRDHNATSYSTETSTILLLRLLPLCRDHNATSYSTETDETTCDSNLADTQRS